MSGDAASAPITGASEQNVGTLRVARLPGRRDRLEQVDGRVVLEEDGTYIYMIDGFEGHDNLEVVPAEELFSFDDASHRRGRLLPRQHVGRVRVLVRAGDVEGTAVLSVEPRKLDAEAEYRQMLDDIADVATEAILQGFAPAALALEHDLSKRPELLYQQFAFLHARLIGQGERDLAIVLNRPHRAWVDHEEARRPGMPLPGGTRNLRALSRPGPRVATPPSHAATSLPVRLSAIRSEETLDSEPNRFIAFALRRWRELALNVHELLAAQGRAHGPISRGLDAAEAVLELVNRTLAAPIFRDVGRLRSFPAGNQVLQKRAGYRELFRTFVLAEAGARLSLDWELEDAFAASQRNIATLYEYWAFIQLAKSVGRVCGGDLSADVLQRSNDGMSLGFVQGRKSALRWTTTARGRAIAVELYFNRQFLVSAGRDASWTRAMRPDCSLLLRPEGLGAEVDADDLAVWLHFDAKYRVEYVDEQFAAPDGSDGQLAVEAEATERVARSKREDLLKMHAYRDAIRRSAGAYVLYPGDRPREPFTEYREVLPGLGAFALRPGETEARGSGDLDRFLAAVLDHVADRATQHERSRFWRTVIFQDDPRSSRPDRRLPALARPPSDVPVLCGYLRGEAHRQWVEQHGLYNVRAGDRRGAVSADAEALRALDIVLYGPGNRPTLWGRAGAWFVQTRDEMRTLGYPDARGTTYLCCPLERRDDEPEWLGQLVLGEGPLSGPSRGAPFVTSWQQLLEAVPL